MKRHFLKILFILKNQKDPTFFNSPSEDKKNEILASIPMKRIGNEKDIVAIIDYLLSKNTYMTGRNINIDGGKSLG